MEQLILLEIKTKRCKDCGEIRNINDFYKNVNVKDGYLNQCKECVNKKRKEYYDKPENDKKRKLRQLEYRNSHKKEIKESDKKYSQTEKGKKVHRKARLKWIENNPEKNIEAKRKYARNNKDKKKKYYEENKEDIIQDNLERRRNSIQLRLKHNVSNLLTKRLKKRLIGKNKKSTFDFLPYTVDELKEHLEKQFLPGMTWENYGFYGWHIDHIIADYHFNYTSVEDEEFQRCWALSNLQPMWAKDNWEKNKFNK